MTDHAPRLLLTQEQTKPADRPPSDAHLYTIHWPVSELFVCCKTCANMPVPDDDGCLDCLEPVARWEPPYLHVWCGAWTSRDM